MLKRSISKVGLLIYFPLLITYTALAGTEPFASGKPLFHKYPISWLTDTLLEKDVINTASYLPEITVNPSMESFITDYNALNGIIFEKLKQTKSSHFETIEKALTNQNLPLELKYLAVVESNLKTTAVSRVGAVGMWQLMPATARNLGLKVSAKVDERKYALKSSIAAAKYLDYLYKVFDDWLLVIAAYNSGPGYVLNAIKKSGSREFWKLQYFLPKETRRHVKRFIATHYYYEGKGSLVTLSKKEREKYLASVEDYLASQKTEEKEKEDTPPGVLHLNWIAVVNDEDNIILIPRR